MPAKNVREMHLRVSRVVDDTPTVRDFRFDLDGHDFTFLPGQFVTIATEVADHGKVTRSYSIASSPTERTCFDLCIKKFADGVLSRFMFDHVALGYVFLVKGPFGKFVWNEDMGDKLALIGAGTGIAPLMCMIRYAAAKALETDIGLLFSNRTAGEIIYRTELDALARSMKRFFVTYTLTRGAPEGWRGHRRRIDRAMIEETFPDVRDRLCYICGAPEMVNDTLENLKAIGVPPERIKTEKYY